MTARLLLQETVTERQVEQRIAKNATDNRPPLYFQKKMENLDKTRSMAAENKSAQSLFLDELKKRLPRNISLADELAELLHISRDSAYRRMRGETILSLDEVMVLSKRFNVSVDEFLSAASDRVTFQMKSLRQDNFTFENWMKSVIENLEILEANQEEKELIYDSKDLPIFHYFQFPNLAAFKIHFWSNSFSAGKKLTARKYDADHVSGHLLSMGKSIWSKYAQLPSTELIRYELLTVTLRQIEYLYDAGLFLHQQDALTLCDECAVMLQHLQAQAAAGTKLTYGTDLQGAKLILYVNEVLIGGNTILFKLGEQRITFLTPNNFDLLMTTNQPFCNITERHIDNLIDKSVLISVTGERDRNRLFTTVAQQVQKLRSKLV